MTAVVSTCGGMGSTGAAVRSTLHRRRVEATRFWEWYIGRAVETPSTNGSGDTSVRHANTTTTHTHTHTHSTHHTAHSTQHTAHSTQQPYSVW